MAPRTREELLAYGVMDPLMAQTIATNPMRSPQSSDPYYGRTDFLALREHRAQILKEKHHLRYIPDAIPSLVSEEDHKITARDGSEINVRIYRPASRDTNDTKTIGRPLVVMFHEGGWSMGDLTDEEVNCRLFSRDLNAVCINVEYRLAPEVAFPTWINDAWDALTWAAANANSLGADPSVGFIIGGASAGGNLTAVLAHMARDQGLSPPLTGQYLCVPAITMFMDPSLIPEKYRGEYLSHPDVTPNQDPILKTQTGPETRAVFQALLKTDLDNKLQVPFHYGKDEKGHRGVAPAYLQVCGLDPLRDEGLLYERILREEGGVPTRVDVYTGYGHCFWSNWPDLPRSREFVEDTVKGIAWLLEQAQKRGTT